MIPDAVRFVNAIIFGPDGLEFEASTKTTSTSVELHDVNPSQHLNPSRSHISSFSHIHIKMSLLGKKFPAPVGTSIGNWEALRN